MAEKTANRQSSSEQAVTFNFNEMDKNELLKVLAYMQSELEAREIVIATLKAEKCKHMLYQAKYGRINSGIVSSTSQTLGSSRFNENTTQNQTNSSLFLIDDAFAALQRDNQLCHLSQRKSIVGTNNNNITDLSSNCPEINENNNNSNLKPVYDNQLYQLENLISSQKKAQLKMKEQIVYLEKKCLKLAQALEDERNKHERDAAQGDDVLVMLEKERERLKSELDYEKSHTRKLERELKRMTNVIEEQKIMIHNQRIAASVIIKTKKQLEWNLKALQSNTINKLVSDSVPKSNHDSASLINSDNSSYKQSSVDNNNSDMMPFVDSLERFKDRPGNSNSSSSLSCSELSNVVLVSVNTTSTGISCSTTDSGNTNSQQSQDVTMSNKSLTISTPLSTPKVDSSSPLSSPTTDVKSTSTHVSNTSSITSSSTPITVNVTKNQGQQHHQHHHHHHSHQIHSQYPVTVISTATTSPLQSPSSSTSISTSVSTSTSNNTSLNNPTTTNYSRQGNTSIITTTKQPDSLTWKTFDMKTAASCINASQIPLSTIKSPSNNRRPLIVLSANDANSGIASTNSSTSPPSSLLAPSSSSTASTTSLSALSYLLNNNVNNSKPGVNNNINNNINNNSNNNNTPITPYQKILSTPPPNSINSASANFQSSLATYGLFNIHNYSPSPSPASNINNKHAHQIHSSHSPLSQQQVQTHLQHQHQHQHQHQNHPTHLHNSYMNNVTAISGQHNIINTNTNTNIINKQWGSSNTKSSPSSTSPSSVSSSSQSMIRSGDNGNTSNNIPKHVYVNGK